MLNITYKPLSLKTKKAIAREFLLFLLVCLISLLANLSIYIYNSYIEKKIGNAYREEISKIALRDTIIKSSNLRFRSHHALASYIQGKSYSNKTVTEVQYIILESAEKFEAALKLIYNEFYSDMPFEEFKTLYIEQQGSLPSQNELLEKRLNDNKIQKLTLEIDSLQKERKILYSQKLTTETEYIQEKSKEKIIYSDQWKFTIKVFFITLGIIFGIRYLYYGVKLSIKTLKE